MHSVVLAECCQPWVVNIGKVLSWSVFRHMITLLEKTLDLVPSWRDKWCIRTPLNYFPHIIQSTGTWNIAGFMRLPLFAFTASLTNIDADEWRIKQHECFMHGSYWLASVLGVSNFYFCQNKKKILLQKSYYIPTLWFGIHVHIFTQY